MPLLQINSLLTLHESVVATDSEFREEAVAQRRFEPVLGGLLDGVSGRTALVGFSISAEGGCSGRTPKAQKEKHNVIL